MDGLELDVCKSCSDKQGQVCSLLVKEKFKLAHVLHDAVRRWRNKHSVAGPGAADPVLTTADFTGLIVTAATVREQDVMQFANQPER